MNFIRQTVYTLMLLYSCALSAAASYDTIEQIDIANLTGQEKQELLLHMLMRSDTGEFLMFFNEEQLEQVTHPDGEFAYLCKPVYQQICIALQASQPDQELQRAADYAAFDTLMTCHTLKAIFEVHLAHETPDKFYEALSKSLTATINRVDVGGETAPSVINALQRVELIYRLQRELEIPLITEELFAPLYAQNVQYCSSAQVMYKCKVDALKQKFSENKQPDQQAIEVFKKASRDVCCKVLENPSQLSIG